MGPVACEYNPTLDRVPLGVGAPATWTQQAEEEDGLKGGLGTQSKEDDVMAAPVECDRRSESSNAEEEGPGGAAPNHSSGWGKCG